jgi:hypothetical protein
LFEEVITDKLDLQEKFPLHKEEIIKGLRLAEPKWDAEKVFDLLEQEIKKDGALEETSFPPGKRFEWMIFKSRRGVSVVRNVEWVGDSKTELQGYVISCQYGQEQIKFFLVKICGNLTLLERKPVPPPKAEAPPRVQAPPSPEPPREFYPRVYIYVYPLPPRYCPPPPPPPPPRYYYCPPPCPPPPPPRWRDCPPRW